MPYSRCLTNPFTLPHNTKFQDVFEISIQLNILVKRLTLGK